MIFRQITHDDLGCASYLIGDEQAGVAAVVDPRLAIEPYLDLARYLGVRIGHVLETHTHADHVSGHGRLRAATRALIHIHRAAGADYDHEPFEDGWELPLGRVRVRALHTPGHRPEHTSFALIDAARGDDPWAVLTGDSLFVGDVARPDLAVDREEGARGIFRSLHERLLDLPPETEVWPGHLGGSLCGGPGMNMKISSTIGYERRHNALLREPDEDRFVARAIADLPPQPPNFRRIVDINRGPLVTDLPDAEALSPRELARRQSAGGLVVDVRTEQEFDEAHIPGAVFVTTLRAGFGTKLAWVAEGAGDVLFVGRDGADGRGATELAGAVGVHAAAGYLAGGMTSWRDEGRPVEAIERLRAGDLAERLDREPDTQVLDVREAGEWREGHIPGALHAPYHDLGILPAGLDSERPVAAICSSGQRSAVAVGLLRRLGVRRVIHVTDGGVGTWTAAGLPVVRP